MRTGWLLRAAGTAAVILGILPGAASASGTALGPPTLPTTAPFQQCAAVFQDPSCGFLIDITGKGNELLVDPSIGYYEGADDVLVGVQNDTSAAVSTIHVGVAGSGSGSFGFDGDGLCTPGGGPIPADCPFGPTGDPGDYWGPDAQLTADPNTSDSGTVTFPTPLQPGQYTYFSLESNPGTTVVVGTQNDLVLTTLTDGGSAFGAHITDPAPTNIVDTARIAGPNVNNGNGAGGTVVYNVYNNSTCAGTPLATDTEPVTNGSANRSTSFGANLPTNATYYVQVSYSGDPATNNDATTSNCGDETFTFGTPPAKAKAVISTSLVGSNGATGPVLSVPTGTAVHDTVSVTSNGQPASGRVSYYVYSDSGCSAQVPGVNLGSGIAVNGAYPPSNTVTLPDGTYYFQAIYSGNSVLSGDRSPCTEVLTVEPPCKCAKISTYLSAFQTFRKDPTRIEFNLHDAVTCTTGAGGCNGTIQVTAPGSAKFITSKGVNGATGVKLRKALASLSFGCLGPCAVRTVQRPVTLQWLALKTIKVKVKRHGKKVTIKKTISAPSFTPKGRARHTFTVTVVETCNGVVTRLTLKIHFNKHGQVDYSKSDLNGDGRPDGRQLTDLTGFV